MCNCQSNFIIGVLILYKKQQVFYFYEKKLNQKDTAFTYEKYYK